VSVHGVWNTEDLQSLTEATSKLNEIVESDFDLEPLELTRYLQGELFFMTIAILQGKDSQDATDFLKRVVYAITCYIRKVATLPHIF